MGDTIKNFYYSNEYENAGHAFANPSGSSYQKKAATDAWKKTKAFLKKYLK